jgi:hypothetical protein
MNSGSFTTTLMNDGTFVKEEPEERHERENGKSAGNTAKAERVRETRKSGKW